MKQIYEIFMGDFRMNMKHWMGAYMAVVPLAILLILRFFIPGMENSKATLAVVTEGSYAVPAEMVLELNDYVRVKEYASIEAMEQKLRSTGSAEGLYYDQDKGQYVSVLEKNLKGNAAFSVAAQVIRRAAHEADRGDQASVVQFTAQVPEELSDRPKTSPVASMGGSIFFVFIIMIAGFFIGLGIVDDKENGTDKAIRVSPVTKTEYFIGKSIFPLILIGVYSIISLWVLGLMDVNIGQVYVMVGISFVLTLLFGLLLGALASNESEAIGIGKLLAWVIMLAILGGTLLPDQWQWAVWWAPFYWVYDIMEGVFTQSEQWVDIAWKGGVTLFLAAGFFGLFRKKIVKGLS